jgi:opacity protein-like surface antigen
MKATRVGMVLMTLAAGGASAAQAQRFGPQLSWSDDFDFGLGARVEIPFEGLFTDEGPFSRTFGIGSFDYFFPDCDFTIEETEFDCSYWELNANLAVPIAASGIDPYAGAGLNVARLSYDYDSDDFPDVEVGSDTEIGLNLLAGLRFPVGGLAAFLEGRFEISGGEQFVLTGGVLLGGPR